MALAIVVVHEGGGRGGGREVMVLDAHQALHGIVGLLEDAENIF